MKSYKSGQIYLGVSFFEGTTHVRCPKTRHPFDGLLSQRAMQCQGFGSYQKQSGHVVIEMLGRIVGWPSERRPPVHT